MVAAVNDLLTWGALLGALGSIIASIKFWMDMGRSQERADDAKKIAIEAHLKVATLEQSFALYRERVAMEFVSRTTLREVEDRISAAIENLGVRLDRAFDDQNLRRQK